MAKIEINQESLIKLVNQVEDNIQEERGLALERYRRQEENLDDSPESFALQGKNLIDLLKVAAERSNTLLNMTRMIAGIVYKDSTIQSGGSGIDDDEIKAEIRRQIQNESSSSDLDLPNSNSN